MYNIKFDKYVPEPNPATTDRIVAAHYYAAWKKGAAGIHEGFNDLAKEFPDRTPLMGYYDEENPEVCDWEIKWAVEHGINCFIYCWYRYLDSVGKPVTEESLRCVHGIHEALFNAKYQKYMKFAIMFEMAPRWGATDEQDLLENLMPFWMETYFKRENYLVIDNKPVLFLYGANRLSREAFRSDEHQRNTFDKCREYCKQFGFDGMVIATCEPSFSPDVHASVMSKGFDFRFGYSAGYAAPVDNYDNEDDIVEQQCALYKKRVDIDPMTFVPTASCFADATPRRSKRWQDLGYAFFLEEHRWYLKPENFRRVLEGMKKISDELPDGAWGKKIMMIDNWNEWDEGHFVAPSHKFGFKYLQAVREVFSERDNLPDYRLPHDQGFEGYNTSWVTPDFREFCRKKLEEN